MKDKIDSIFNDFENEKARLKGKENSIARVIYTNTGIVFKLYFSPHFKMRGMCIELNEDFKKMKFEIQSNGFFYKYNEKKIYIEEQGEFVSNIFKTFILDLMPATEQSLNVSLYLDTLKRKIIEWRDFFQNIQRNNLNKETVMGIFGEVYFLKKLIDDEKIQDTTCWRGPVGARSDFLFPEFRIEVKSTTSRNPVKISISNEIQLEIEKDELLYLLIIQLIENEDGLSLKQLISETERSLVKRNLDIVDFFKKLESLGCNSEVLETSSNYIFKSYSIEFFQVLENFPRITKTMVPNGIIDLKYSILKDSIESYKISFSDLF